ncbi:hypothetical protein CEXT_210791 [Caerostris extrusa]|uniref:Uncharacterized protein n=1 Tax=Caerostris extrusa TaxID=172846 RepID=A0AAV4P8K9_CAEEX|nr:hypothetical protein CEXT_210791 [Caerostris extrusa]
MSIKTEPEGCRKQVGFPKSEYQAIQNGKFIHNRLEWTLYQTCRVSIDRISKYSVNPHPLYCKLFTYKQLKNKNIDFGLLRLIYTIEEGAHAHYKQMEFTFFNTMLNRHDKPVG